MRGVEVVGTRARWRRPSSSSSAHGPHAVTLDGNLRGQLSRPVAARLEELGIRYLVVTGYVELTLADPHLSKAPRLNKPFTAGTLVEAAAKHLC